MKRRLLFAIVLLILVSFALYGQTVTIKPGDILYHPAEYAVDNPLALPFALLYERFGVFGHVGLVDWSYKVIEATRKDGIIQNSIADFVNRYSNNPYPFVYVLRVNTSQTVVAYAIQFATEQLGKPYDFDYLGKWVFGPSYYGSELVWAAYQYASGAHYDSSGRLVYGYIDLDAGDPAGYVTPGLVVTPNEILRSSWVYTVAKIYSR